MTAAEEFREKMRQGYLPDPSVHGDHRATRTLEYIAFFLGEISQKLDRLIENQEPRNSSRAVRIVAARRLAREWKPK